MPIVIDSFKKGAFMPSYIRTLEEVFGKGNVHLITLSSDYDHIGISTFVVVGESAEVDMDNFVGAVKTREGDDLPCDVSRPIAGIFKRTLFCDPHG